MKKYIAIFLSVITLQGCSREADLASRNLSTAADQFEIIRRIVFYNGVTGEPTLCCVCVGHNCREATEERARIPIPQSQESK